MLTKSLMLVLGFMYFQHANGEFFWHINAVRVAYSFTFTADCINDGKQSIIQELARTCVTLI